MNAHYIFTPRRGAVFSALLCLVVLAAHPAEAQNDLGADGPTSVPVDPNNRDTGVGRIGPEEEAPEERRPDPPEDHAPDVPQPDTPRRDPISPQPALPGPEPLGQPPREDPPRADPPSDAAGPEEAAPRRDPPPLTSAPEEPPQRPVRPNRPRQIILGDRYRLGDPQSNVTPQRKPPWYPFEIPGGEQVTPPTTKAISDAVLGVSGFCERIEDIRYRVDCLSERLEALGQAMPDTGEYAQARQIVLDTAQRLHRLAVSNRSTRAPKGRARGKLLGKPVRTRPLTPVQEQRVDPVHRQAAVILQEAETRLLRSAQASERRLIAYARIATAVGSSKKLLRAA